jgi:hypothetical protein
MDDVIDDMSISFSFELLLAVWATSMVGLIWWSTADAASLPDAATRGELYASRLNGLDFWTHITESDLARTAARAQGHPITPEDAATRVLEHLQTLAAASTDGQSPQTFRITDAKRCHLSGYGYILVTASPSGANAAWSDVVRCVVYADGEIGSLIPQTEQQGALAKA